MHACILKAMKSPAINKHRDLTFVHQDFPNLVWTHNIFLVTHFVTTSYKGVGGVGALETF